MDVHAAPRNGDLTDALREVQHRIKNTLQLATDILTLQASASGGNEVAQALERAATRIRALGAVHEKAAAPQEDVSRVEIRPLLQAVAQGLQGAAMRTGDGLAPIVDAPETSVPSREASALALIAGELISNVLTHSRATECTVRYVEDGDEVVLEVADNGTGEAEPDEILASQGLGLELVQLLAEEQLGGTFRLERVSGWTRASVRFTRHP